MKMKKIALILIAFWISCSLLLPAAIQAQPVEDVPEPVHTPTSSASFTGGLIIFLSVGMGYAMRKLFEIRSMGREEE